MKFIPLNIPENIVRIVSGKHSGDVDFMNVQNVTKDKDIISVKYGYNNIVDETSYRRYFINLKFNFTDRIVKAVLDCEQIEKNEHGNNITIPLTPPFSVDYKFDIINNPQEEGKGIALFTLNLFEYNCKT